TREGRLEDRRQVDRVAPAVRFFLARGAGVEGRQAGQDRAGVLPAGPIERLEGFVREVEDMAGVQEAVVGGGGEEHAGDRGRRVAGPDGGGDAALGALAVAHLDELAEPAGEDGW